MVISLINEKQIGCLQKEQFEAAYFKLCFIYRHYNIRIFRYVKNITNDRNIFVFTHGNGFFPSYYIFSMDNLNSFNFEVYGK